MPPYPLYPTHFILYHSDLLISSSNVPKCNSRTFNKARRDTQMLNSLPPLILQNPVPISNCERADLIKDFCLSPDPRLISIMWIVFSLSLPRILFLPPYNSPTLLRFSRVTEKLFCSLGFNSAWFFISPGNSPWSLDRAAFFTTGFIWQLGTGQ